MRPRHLSLLSFAFALACYSGVLLIGQGRGLGLAQAPELGLLAVLSLALVVFDGRRSAVAVLVGLRLIVSLLAGIPLAVGDGREELLFYPLVADCLLHLPGFWGIPAAGITLALSLANQHAWKTWDLLVPAAAPGELAAYGLRLGAVFGLAAAIRVLYLLWRRAEDEREHIGQSIQAVMEANLRLQGWAVQTERQTTEAERKRVTREVHDIIGFSLTNQLMVLEACLLLAGKDTGKLKAMLGEARGQLKDGLEEIRRELRQLRDSGGGRRASLSELHYLCRIFQEATGVEVRLSLAARSAHIGPALFHCLYRIVQQGLTNSFFHGRATVVEVQVTEQEGTLHLSVSDNGVAGSKGGAVEPGIGLTGMAERLAPFGGTLGYARLSTGFQLNVAVPLDGAAAGEETP